MAAAAVMTQRPKRGLPGGAWLSMAPSEEQSMPAPQPPPPAPARQSPPKPPKRATFSLGAEDTSSTNTPVTPGSQDGGSSSAMSPIFDVRASFAPLVFKKPTTTQATTATTGHIVAQQDADQSGVEDDGHGIFFAGRKWKGKTAHAVEQEMEKAGDVSIMSYAPDAVYLASRLHGLQRNIEAAGDEARGRRWLDFDDDEGDAEMASMVEEAPGHFSPNVRVASKDGDEDDSQLPDDRRPATLPAHITDYIQPPAPLPSSDTLLPRLDPSAKAAALDSRVEIRLLRRSDLEQVRDLHCLHGDSEKADVDHYVTSAAFLLRLLVDEAHVCVVAVAKPLPEPEAPLSIDAAQSSQHAPHLVPRCPPPSMDMPATSAPYLFARQGITSNSPMLVPVDGSNKPKRPRFVAPPSSLGKMSPLLGTMRESDEEEGDGDADSDVAEQDDASSSPGSSSPRSQSSSPSPQESGAATSVLSTSPRDAMAKAKAVDRHGVQASGSASSSYSSGMAPHRAYSAAPATHRDMVLAGPTNEVAPPRALRVMVPPAPGASLESETILGVASASVRIRPATESLWGEADAAASKPHKEIHLLTLAVARAERGLGLGGRLLQHVTEEASRRNVGSAYRAQMGRRYSAASGGSMFGPTRTYLEVHAESAHALSLYTNRGFTVADRLKGYFRGDVRIPTEVRSLPGGSDALLLERYEDSAGQGS